MTCDIITDEIIVGEGIIAFDYDASSAIALVPEFGCSRGNIH
jgi:hypothetical protein